MVFMTASRFASDGGHIPHRLLLGTATPSSSKPETGGKKPETGGKKPSGTPAKQPTLEGGGGGGAGESGAMGRQLQQTPLTYVVSRRTSVLSDSARWT